MREPKNSKIALGTANFSSHYGIANTKGIIPFRELFAIVSYAHNRGIKTIDTAAAYGDSEQILGRIGVNRFEVVTKVGRIIGRDVCAEIEASIANSKVSICSQMLYGLLLHSSDQLLGPDGKQIARALENTRDKGLVNKVGISIYGPENLDRMLKVFRPNIIQAPYNILDQRLSKLGWVDKLKTLGVEIHIRSVFLQGLLTLPCNKIPHRFNGWKNIFASWFEMQCEAQLSAVDLALGYCLAQDWADKIIIGVDSLEQLKKLLEVNCIDIKIPEIFSRGLIDERLINPATWDDL